MYVQLKFPIRCDAPAAWRAVRSVSVVREIYSPVLDVHPITDFLPTEGDRIDRERVLSPGTMWEAGSVECEVRLLGFLPIGRQIIRVQFTRARAEDANIFEDTGGATAGPLALLRGWKHRMAISVDPDHPERALWRDRVDFHGPFAPLCWPALWLLWQVRGARIRALAPGWTELVSAPEEPAV